MKRIFSTMLLFLAGGALMMTSCDDDDDNGGGGSAVGKIPFESVMAKDGAEMLTAAVDDVKKTIDFAEFKNLKDLKAVEVTFKLNKGYTLKTPAKPTSTVDLSTPYKVEVVKEGKQTLAYTMTAPAITVSKAILGAKVNGTAAEISDDNVISVKWADGMNINQMVFELELSEGAEVKSPKDLTFDLEFGNGELVVSYLGQDLTYVVKVTDYVDPMIALGWTDVSTEFAPLPAYIKVYKTTKAAGVDNNIAYVAKIGGQATMGCVGNGTKELKSLTDLEADGAYKVYVVGVVSSTNQLMVRDGKIIQNDSRISGALGQNEDGSYQLSYGHVIDGKLYTFPFRASGSYENPVVANGTPWAPKNSVGGLHMILCGGKILTEADVNTNESVALFYKDTDLYARAAVGVTKNNKIYAFCGQQVDGSKGVSNPQLAKIMQDLGCEDAMTFEASGTPNLHINKKETVKNSKAPNLKAVQVALAFK